MQVQAGALSCSFITAVLDQGVCSLAKEGGSSTTAWAAGWGWLSTLNPIGSSPFLGKGQREWVLLQRWVMSMAMVPWNCAWPQQ